ncbi:MAG: LamG domain-containing protein [Fibrobacteria bacterium]
MNTRILWCALGLFLGKYALAQKVVDWKIDNLKSIGGITPTLLGNPKVIPIEGISSVAFNGKVDGLTLEASPMIGAEEFTVEVIFYPYSGNVSTAPRFVHMQQDEDNRITVELRILGTNKWILDTFIKSSPSERTLLSDTAFRHPTDAWHHAALVYRAGQMSHFVNGAKELSGAVTYRPVTGGQSSLGVRLNKTNYFNGAIRQLRVTHKALTTDQFLSADPVATTISTGGINRKGDAGSRWESVFCDLGFQPVPWTKNHFLSNFDVTGKRRTDYGVGIRIMKDTRR